MIGTNVCSKYLLGLVQGAGLAAGEAGRSNDLLFSRRFFGIPTVTEFPCTKK
jgi:hypothetical protein